MFNRYARPTPQNWRDMRGELQQARQLLRQKGSIMSPFELSEFKAELEREAQQFGGSIQAGAIGEFKTAIQKVKDARGKIERAQQQEARRFDLARLAGEMQAIQILSDMAITRPQNWTKDGGSIKALQQIYKDAMAGDIIRQRAAAEIFSNLVEKLPAGSQDQIKFSAVDLSEQAKRDLAALRTIPEIAQAQAEERQAVDILSAAQSEVMESHHAIYGDRFSTVYPISPFEKATLLVKWDSNTGAPDFLPEDAPEVTGVYFRPENMVTGGEK